MTKQDEDKYYLMAPLNAHIGEALDYANRVDRASSPVAPDDATDRRSARSIIKTLAFIFVVPGAITVILPIFLLAASAVPPVEYASGLRFIGAIPIVCGALIYVWCASAFVRAGRGTPAPSHPPHNFVQHGLYQYSRNPMYLGVGLMLMGESTLFESAVLLIYTSLVLISFHLRVVHAEEPTLRQKYGETYVQYCQSVPRWLGISRRHIQEKP